MIAVLGSRDRATVREIAAAIGRVYGVLQRAVDLGLAVRVDHGTYAATSRVAPWVEPSPAARVEAALLLAGEAGYDLDALARALLLPRRVVARCVERLVAEHRAGRVRAGIWRAT